MRSTQSIFLRILGSTSFFDTQVKHEANRASLVERVIIVWDYHLCVSSWFLRARLSRY